MAWGDYDNDGYLDVIVTGDPGNLNGLGITKLYHNNGDGTFSPAPFTFAPYRSSSVAWGDYDNDGYLDLIITGLNPDGVTRIYHNLGGTNFVEVMQFPAVYDGQVSWADFDNDGKLDFAITGAGPYSQIYRNINKTNFIPLNGALPQLYYGSVGWADFDHDGNLDLLLTGMSTTSPQQFEGATVFRNDGSGHFQSSWFRQFASEPGLWIDFDNDGWPDLALQQYSYQTTYLYHNDHQGGWPLVTTLPFGPMVAADFNNDGWNDLLIGNTIFQNSGAGAWNPVLVAITNLTCVACGDFDNDGRLDIIGCDSGGSTYSTRLYRNLVTASNLPPSIPGGLNSTSTSTNVILGWAASTDDHQAGGITYNLRVGTSPGGFDVISPMSASNGFRRVVRVGNAGYMTSYNLRGLQAGKTYYWSVQAVDNSFSGSPFSPEQSFIATTLPSISTFSNQTILQDSGPLIIPFTVGDLETPANLLTVTATSSNSLLVDQTNLIITGSGTNRTLNLTTQPDQNGSTTITITVTDGNGGQSTRQFLLTVLPVSALQVVSVSSTSAVVTVPINLVAVGTENALGFSLSFDHSLLSFTGATLGSGDATASLLVNSNLIAGGQLGVALSLPVNAGFSPGTQQVALVSFAVAPVNITTVSPLVFGDQPILRQVSDIQASALSVTYSNGTVTVPFGFEGDVSPRPAGNGATTIIDWVQVGRFVAGLDTTANAGEFQKADCAPRSTLGDGLLTVADWVQAGRYAAGLDPLTLAGGPTGPVGGVPSPASLGHTKSGLGSSDRTLTILSTNAQAGQACQVSVVLNSQGDENALGFSLTFDPSVLSFTGADLGGGADGAKLNVNSNLATDGTVAMALALPVGSSFNAAPQQVLKLNFMVAASAKGSLPISFASAPVAQDVADANAASLSTAYVDGAVTIPAIVQTGNPVLTIVPNNAGNIILSWPASASGFNLEYSGDFTSTNWTSVVTAPVTNGGDITITLPMSGSQQFYRLRQP
ncbi:MAG: regulatory domain of in-like proprotein convertase [Pedosphaera sp.]|nr:regulatory domain of in-like proprotein convertase [Pedosphaera sp.]